MYVWMCVIFYQGKFFPFSKALIFIIVLENSFRFLYKFSLFYKMHFLFPLIVFISREKSSFVEKEAIIKKRFNYEESKGLVMYVYVCLLPLKGRLCQCFIAASSFISFHVMSEEKEELYCCYCS